MVVVVVLSVGLDRDGVIGREHGEWQLRLPLKVAIDRGCRGATFGDGPDDERLTTASVTGYVNTGLGGCLPGVPLDRALLAER